MGNKRKIKKYNKLLSKFQQKREFVKIYRRVTEGEANIYGVILKFSDNYLYLAQNEEFRFNGQIIIPMDHYDAIRCNKFEKTYKKILKTEGQLTKTKPKGPEIDLSTWSSIFLDLKKIDFHVIIECEDLKRSKFTIGPIAKVHSKSVSVKNYDATGKLNKKSTRIKFKNITLVKFGDEYSVTFRKYLK